MYKTKLISILGSFSEKEISLFEKWMKSSFFNTNDNQVALLKYIAGYHPDFDNGEINKTKVFGHLFPSETYNDARLRNLISDLQEKAEKFLTWSAFFENKVLQQQLLLTELNSRKQHSLFESRLKEARKEIEDSKMNSFSATLNQFLLDEEEFLHHFTVNYGRAYKVSQKYDTEKVIRSATNVYLIHTLYYYHKLLDDQKKYGQPEQMFGNFEKVANELYVTTGQDNILALIYLKVIKLLHSGNTDYFFEIKKEMKKKEFDSLSDHDQQSVVVILSNFIAREHLNGSERALPEILELGAISLKKRFCFLGPHISHIFFLNYVNFLIAG
ncbi:MAG TPA: hypothetical protein VFJ43_07700, partial [Bacteroidia bacterium]|nr:hypothetical protein [Bacteroidia bacterium]